MLKYRTLLLWTAALAAGVALTVWGYPLAVPFFPSHWTVSRGDAQMIALARLGDLGELPERPYVVARMDDDFSLERRLLLALRHGSPEELAESQAARQVLFWEVTVYGPGARPGDWTHQARIAFDGEVLSLRRGFQDDEPGGEIDDEEARRQADAFLTEQGFDLAALEAPEVRRVDRDKRTDLVFRYRWAERVLDEGIRYGVAVNFAGDRLAGFAPWRDDPGQDELFALVQPATLIGNLNFFSTYLALPFVAVFFLRRYHAGEVGVKRGLQIFGLAAVLGLLVLLFTARPSTQGQFWGSLTRQQITFLWGAQLLLLYFLPQGAASFLSWSVGESFCRERWGSKLAAFDALFQRQWHNQTVAVSSLRGYALGWLIAGLLVAAQALLGRHADAWVSSAFLFGPFWNNGPAPGLLAVAFFAGFILYTTLFGRLFLVSLLARRVGVWIAGALVSFLTGMLFFAPTIVLPVEWTLLIGILYAAALVFLFLRFDLLTCLSGALTSQLVLNTFPFLFAESASVEMQGWFGVLAGAVPLALSARYLLSDEVFVYRYEDVPPHVRRIAERERQRVELETARNIQSSILPQLPPQLGGVELAHTYLPATEVGGDFYDVLALEDGRLAVAVGDVAGHGVSSGLVMSMAKSALAVQVTFDPRVEAVFVPLNRMVHQSARKRLLATLCYALIDPKELAMDFASAGHLFPYRVSKDGRVEALESVAYPLGVRPALEIRPQRTRLESGDIVFLFSDGLVEARAEGSEELFGFERLERLLGKYAGHGATVVRDAVLRELGAFVGPAPREDDLTLLVLRIP